MKYNRRLDQRAVTHEGGRGYVLQPEEELYKLSMTLMLREPRYYEGGNEQVVRLIELCELVEPEIIEWVADTAKFDMYLRSTPLFLALQHMDRCRGTRLAARARELIVRMITRCDQMAEILAMYWRDGRRPLPSILKEALREAFGKFSEYDYAKWKGSKRDAISLRDVMFLVHPLPAAGREALYKHIADNTLPPPDTWEVHISQAKSTKERRSAWTNLLNAKKLGDTALLMNIRNMVKDTVPSAMIADAIDRAPFRRVFPYSIYAAAKASSAIAGAAPGSPVYEALDRAFLRAATQIPGLPGRTAILVDVSGSMSHLVSQRSCVDLRRAAACLAVIAAAAWGEGVDIFSFSDDVAYCSAITPGFDMVQRVATLIPWGGTYLGAALTRVLRGAKYDHVIVLTDEQIHDKVPPLPEDTRGYIVSMCGYKASAVRPRGQWEILGGFSDAVWRYVAMADAFFDRRDVGEKNPSEGGVCPTDN